MSTQSRKWSAVLVLLACSLSACAGCGRRLATAEGRVTFDGQPVQEGTISLEPADGRGPTAGCAIQGGEYRVTRLVPGKKIVRITAQRKTGRKVLLSTQMPPGMAPPGMAPDATIEEIERYIPVRYNTQSELTAEVTSDGNQFDFALKSW